MYIHGFYTQGNIAKFLARAEDQLTPSEFYNTILEQQNLDPANFFCSSVPITDKGYVFIVTEHPGKQAAYRTMLNKAQMRTRSAEILRNPLIGVAVTESPVYLNDDDEVEGISTAVVDEQSGLMFLFQSGFSYIRLVTVWNTRSRVFYAKPNTKVIKLRANGFMEANPDNIPEVIIMREADSRKKKPNKFNTRTWRKE